MKTASVPNGESVPALGQGTWRMGERADLRATEIATLREGVDLGMTLIDTAEMYGDGKTESLVGEALDGIRERVFLVSKAYPQNASKARLPKACEASLRRLGTDRIDLYLLHWRGSVPLAETAEAMNALVEAGKIRHWGVSNLDTSDMAELVASGGKACACNQILYNLTRRNSEHDLLPWLDARGIPAMAYSPVEQGRLLANKTLNDIARSLDATAAQVAIAWLLRRPNLIVIPKAGSIAHVRENGRASGLVLQPEDVAALEKAFPLDADKRGLEML